MKVFIVEENFDYDGNQFRHVYFTFEEAKKFCEAEHTFRDFFITEYDMETHLSGDWQNIRGTVDPKAK